MAKILNLLKLFWSTSIMAEMEYRLNFVIALVACLTGMAGSVFGLSLFYRTGYQFAGWKWEEAVAVLGMFMILDGLLNVLLAANLSSIVTHVRTGTLDFVLLKPLDSQFWLSTRRIRLDGIPDILLGLGLVVWSGIQAGAPWWGWLCLPVALALSTTILYSLWFILAATSVWFVKIYNLTEVLRGLCEAGRFPSSAYPGVWRTFFTFVVPVVFLTTVPAEVLLGRANPSWLAAFVLLAVGLFMVSRLFWRFALRFYTSASS